MKQLHYFYILCIVLVSSLSIKGQHITISGQLALNNFDQSLTTINGNLIIKSLSINNPITDLSNLSNITNIAGHLYIQNSDSISHLNGLSNLTSVGGQFLIDNNAPLSNLNALSTLTTVGSDFRIYNNGALSDLNGLSNLTTVGDLMISTNAALLSLDGLSNFTTVDRDLIIYNNAALLDLNGLSNLTTIEDLRISTNAALLDLDGLSNITTIDGSLEIDDNASLLNLNGLLNIISVNGGFKIDNNAALSDLSGLLNLTTVGDILLISSNASLSNLSGLSNLTFVGYDLVISSNASLTNLNGLSNLTTVAYRFRICDNASLLNLNGLSNLTSVYGLEICDNAALLGLDGLPNLTSVPSLEIDGNASLLNLDGLSNFTSVSSLRVIDNASLLNLDGLSNTSVGNEFIIHYNPALTSCCAIQHMLELNTPNLTSIDNNLSACSNIDDVEEAFCGDLEIFVDASAMGFGNGDSWQDAFTDLQDALSLVSNETEVMIRVAEGTYLPSQNGIRGKSFEIPKGTTLSGGYPQGGGIRNPDIHETILSGNVDNINTIAGNSYHVVTVKNVEDVVLEGLTIRDGNANNTNSFGRARGGGIYIVNSSVELNSMDIKWNRGIYGGGLFASESDVTIRQSIIKKNQSDYGSGIYHSNATNLYLLRSQVVDNTSNVRCAIEMNNASKTQLKNSLIVNNISTNVNALGIIATNRNATVQVLNSTILGGTKNRNLITYQIGNNDQLDVIINNSIIAHQDTSFDKTMVAYNYNVLNLNHSHCYFSGSSTIGNGNGNLFEDMDGELLLNSDYTVDVCSPVIDAGNDTIGIIGYLDYYGNFRYYNTIDIGAYESQASCSTFPKKNMREESTFFMYPNPTNDVIYINGSVDDVEIRVYDILGQQIFLAKNLNVIDLKDQNPGIYFINFRQKNELIQVEKVIKQ